MEVNKDLIDELILLEDRNVGNLTNLTILTFVKYFGGIIYFWLLYIHIFFYIIIGFTFILILSIVYSFWVGL
jgi:hypothetical protein